jgi:hypothetical protein
MAGIPTTQWNVRPPVGTAPSRTMVVPLLHAPHHAHAVSQIEGQRAWLAQRLFDLGATDADMLTVATVARQKPPHT